MEERILEDVSLLAVEEFDNVFDRSATNGTVVLQPEQVVGTGITQTAMTAVVNHRVTVELHTNCALQN